MTARAFSVINQALRLTESSSSEWPKRPHFRFSSRASCSVFESCFQFSLVGEFTWVPRGLDWFFAHSFPRSSCLFLLGLRILLARLLFLAQFDLQFLQKRGRITAARAAHALTAPEAALHACSVGVICAPCRIATQTQAATLRIHPDDLARLEVVIGKRALRFRDIDVLILFTGHGERCRAPQDRRRTKTIRSVTSCGTGVISSS